MLTCKSHTKVGGGLVADFSVSNSSLTTDSESSDCLDTVIKLSQIKVTAVTLGVRTDRGGGRSNTTDGGLLHPITWRKMEGIHSAIKLGKLSR